MTVKFNTTQEYLSALPDERRVALVQIVLVIRENLPHGFEETMNYGMITYVVPHALYPAGYHCDPKLALPFISIASQKNFIAIYHMGIYSDVRLLEWWQTEFPKHSKSKLDMGKSCIRFKKMNDIPYSLIGELCAKISPQDWIMSYEKNYKP